MRRLWYSRHHYMSRVIEELGLNVAVIDGDMSVRSDFYPELKRPPLAAHNLIYTLDHGPKCGDLNVGFAYCQGCRPKGRAQWVIDEGLYREGYFCGGTTGSNPREEFEGDGDLLAESDAAARPSGPHAWIPWTTARDQKVYSDVVGGSCCGKPQYRLMFPATHKVLDQYAFMRQWGQHAGCMTMAPQMANGLQTWWHQLLQGNDRNLDAAETVAIATGRLASGWHGTGEGELAGWAGHWHYKPPAIAHFVGGAPAGGKVDLMQGLSWWLYEADVVAHAVKEETGKKAGMALPGSFFSARSQRGLLAISGNGARASSSATAPSLCADSPRCASGCFNWAPCSSARRSTRSRIATRHGFPPTSQRIIGAGIEANGTRPAGRGRLLTALALSPATAHPHGATTRSDVAHGAARHLWRD